MSYWDWDGLWGEMEGEGGNGMRVGGWLVEEWDMEIWGGFEIGRGAFTFVGFMFVFAVLFKWHADGIPFLRGWGDRKDDDCSAVIPPFRHKNHFSFGCDWKGAYLVSLFLFVVVKTDR